MAAAARSTRAPNRTSNRAKPGPVRPRLRVVEGGRGAGEKSASRRARTALTLSAAVLVSLCVFGLVVLNIYVAQSSFKLSELGKQVAREEARYRQMRYEVSLAESPARLTEVADRLGLVTPEHQETLEGPVRQVEAGGGQAAEGAAARDLKALLARSPGR